MLKIKQIYSFNCVQTYEQRYYPAATYVCNKTKNIDTAADPFGGLEKMNPWKVMSSKRWKHHHTSKMFMELFKYISGVNKVNNVVKKVKIRLKKFGMQKGLFRGSKLQKF